MKFLHTADLHLDSAFCLSSATEAAARRERQREVLREIFVAARAEKCDMVLIAGDLFNSIYVSPETKELCLRLFADFEKPIIISPGNHDPYVDGSFYGREDIPDNVYIFSSDELQFFDFPELDTTVAGYAFLSGALAESPLAAQPPVRHNQRIRLLCAHAETDLPTSNYAPIPSSVLARLGYDYIALGHIHKYTELAENIRYCGFCEGRSFDEQGDGGVLIVTTDGLGTPSVERRVLSRVRYLTDEFSVDGLDTAQVLRDRVTNRIKELCADKPTHLRLELVGVVSPEAQEGIDLIEGAFEENVLSYEIINSTLALPSADFLARDTTLRGEFYRSLEPILSSEDVAERKATLLALRIGLAAIDGRDFTDKRQGRA